MPDSFTAPVHRMLASGMTIAQTLVELQRLGFTPQQAVMAVHRATTLPFDEIERRSNE